MASYKIDVQEETGQVILQIETPCGIKPVIGWKKLDNMKSFAEMLMDFYWTQKMRDLKITNTAEDIVRQALGLDE